MKFILTRRGRFQIRQSSPNQCKGPGHLKYKYVVELTCGNKLNPNGFVVDHVVINDIVQETVRTSRPPKQSCEQLNIAIIENIHRILTERGVLIFELKVEIEPDVRNPISKLQIIY